MKRVFRVALRSLFVAGLLAGGALAGAVAWARYGPPPLTVRSGAFPEEVVYVRSTDDIVNAGMVFAPPKSQAKPIAIIWLHGWGVNFYSPTYVMIGRALAERGLTTISVNTRMHDLGTVAGHRFGKRLRGGAYWGVTSEGVWILPLGSHSQPGKASSASCSWAQRRLVGGCSVPNSESRSQNRGHGVGLWGGSGAASGAGRSVDGAGDPPRRGR